MDKEKLLKLSEDFEAVERKIYELGSELHRLSCHMENIKYSIMEVLKDAVDAEGKTKLRRVSKRSKKVQESQQVEPVELPAVQDQEPKSTSMDAESLVILPESESTPETVVEIPRQKPRLPQCDTPVPMGQPIKIRYCSMVISNEFEFSDTETTKSIRSIYVIEEMTDSLARFYPIADKAKHLIMKRAELVDPVCVADYDLTPEDFSIDEEAYGILQKNMSGRWNIIKQCSLLH
jgi:hypothetical protein